MQPLNSCRHLISVFLFTLVSIMSNIRQYIFKNLHNLTTLLGILFRMFKRQYSCKTRSIYFTQNITKKIMVPIICYQNKIPISMRNLLTLFLTDELWVTFFGIFPHQQAWQHLWSIWQKFQPPLMSPPPWIANQSTTREK